MKLPILLPNIKKILLMSSCGLLCLNLSACGFFGKSADNQLNNRQIAKLIPSRVKNSSAWASDIADILKKLDIDRSKENVCSVIAIVDQESNFVADPVVTGLGEKSLKELNSRLEDKLGKDLAPLFQNMLQNEPSKTNSFAKQIRQVRTERELDELYRHIFSHFTEKYYASTITNVSKMVGGDISEMLNPITTLGSMQVHIDYAKQHRRSSMSNEDLRRDLYSQYGGLYYGIHRLMLYSADYPEPLYRFADYNSGMYSSRNAGFQKMLSVLSKKPKLPLDGDLLLYEKGGSVRSARSQTEETLIKFFQSQQIALTERQIRADLKKEKTRNFEETETYKTIGKLYKLKTGKEPLYAIMPKVVISGPKLSQNYNTKWFADRVNARYQTCMQKSKTL